MTIRNTGLAMGEISIEDMVKIDQFIKDMADIAIQIRDIVKAEQEAENKKRVEAAQQRAEQQRLTEEQQKIERERLAEQQRQESERRQSQKTERKSSVMADQNVIRESPTTAKPNNTVTAERIVYRTHTGDKYHLEWCSYLRSSKFPISLKDAINRGLTPCSRCRPPIQ
jgi:hypothetical protein